MWSIVLENDLERMLEILENKSINPKLIGLSIAPIHFLLANFEGVANDQSGNIPYMLYCSKDFIIEKNSKSKKNGNSSGRNIVNSGEKIYGSFY